MSHPSSTGRRMFLLLAVLFAAPVVGAYLLYFVFPEWAPAGRTNYGQLQSPPQPMPQAPLADVQGQRLDVQALHGKWTLVYVARRGCDEACRARLVLGRQWRLALNEKRERVQRVYLDAQADRLHATQSELAEQHPDLRWLADSSGRLSEFFEPEAADAYLLLDPRGNWILTYPLEPGSDSEQADFRGMQKDIKKLLRNTSG